MRGHGIDSQSWTNEMNVAPLPCKQAYCEGVSLSKLGGSGGMLPWENFQI